MTNSGPGRPPFEPRSWHVDTARRIRENLDRIDELQRETDRLMMKLGQGPDTASAGWIARQLGISRNAVEWSIRRALRELDRRRDQPKPSRRRPL